MVRSELDLPNRDRLGNVLEEVRKWRWGTFAPGTDRVKRKEAGRRNAGIHATPRQVLPAIP